MYKYLITNMDSKEVVDEFEATPGEALSRVKEHFSQHSYGVTLWQRTMELPHPQTRGVSS